ncbi:hypothetical protein ASE74_13465 [Pedobacter sp. Leaf216]|uniref:hypothetical protein n=1 Tax=Pedobacter sp. Leaf216 TaxID=1735684 RepID=UPI0006F6AA02|nr:hypothetical protein [Pedobacter sp. Leaf216]KQM78507.1 hypothetical protein ASE74_13465 [Pedobacter sp. Leaf216]
MIKLAYSTPISRLDKIKVGDEITDEYQSTGRVTQITKNIKDKFTEFIFLLDSRQTIFILCTSG